jgi:hypothetical protein
MSYILDALRRLEQDKEKARKPANPLQTVLHSGPEIDLRFRKTRRPFWPWILTGLLVFLVAVGVTFWIGRITAPEMPSGSEPSVARKIPPVAEAGSGPGSLPRERGSAVQVAEALRPEVGSPPAASTDHPADLPPGESSAVRKVPPVREGFPMSGRLPGPRGSAGQVAESRSGVGSRSAAVPDILPASLPRSLSGDVPPPAPEDSAEPFASSAIADSPAEAEPAWETLKPAAEPLPETPGVDREPTSSQERLEPKRKRGGAVARTEQDEIEQELASVPRLTGSETGIRISAIVWSPNRDKRFAIVNMKTVHAGDPVDGNTVVEIGEDAVVFEKEGTRFSVGIHGH